MNYQRCDSDDVQAIFATNLDVQPYIKTATLIVSERLAGHYSDARLREIEIWLSAYLASGSASSSSSGGGGQVSQVRADEITVSYATARWGKGSRVHGMARMVRMLDYKGILQQDMTSTVAHFSVH